MTTRSPYDQSSPSPSEELIGICHGILNGNTDYCTSIEAIKSWMISHLSDEEIARMEKRDPLWCFENETNEEAMSLVVEYGKRIKNGKLLAPLQGMKYIPRIKKLSEE